MLKVNFTRLFSLIPTPFQPRCLDRVIWCRLLIWYLNFCPNCVLWPMFLQTDAKPVRDFTSILHEYSYKNGANSTLYINMYSSMAWILAYRYNIEVKNNGTLYLTKCTVEIWLYEEMFRKNFTLRNGLIQVYVRNSVRNHWSFYYIAQVFS